MKIVSVTAEAAPWCRTGGLGDVTGALPAALCSADTETTVTTLVPLYTQVRDTMRAKGVELVNVGVESQIVLKGQRLAATWKRAPGPARQQLFFLECDPLFEGPGLYEMAGAEAPLGPLSLAHRFAGFAQAVEGAMERLVGGTPDVVHLHDWHAGALATRLRDKRLKNATPRIILTIHNLAYQGWFSPAEIEGLDLPNHDYISFLRVGIDAADLVTTVSPQYAKEVQTEAFGCGLEKVLEDKGVRGVLNGVDPQEWNPEIDPHIAAPYSAHSRSGKGICRAALLREAGWDDIGDDLLFGVVTRLAEQKGVDWILESVPQLAKMGARIILLGNGDPDLEASVRDAVLAHPGRLSAQIRFDSPLSHQIIAGTDAFLIPSRFEPCGLTQLYAMRYGTVPIVNPVGGLADTVAPLGDAPVPTGIHMGSADGNGLIEAMRRASALWHEERATWDGLVTAGFDFDSTWKRSAECYLALYRELCAD